MFVFYGKHEVATGYPKFLGISIDPNNTAYYYTCATTDASKCHVIAYPYRKPAGTKTVIFIPDEFTWMGTASYVFDRTTSNLSHPEGAVTAAVRPFIEYEAGHAPTVTGFGFGTLNVNISKTGVSFYTSSSDHVTFGYCPTVYSEQEMICHLTLSAVQGYDMKSRQTFPAVTVHEVGTNKFTMRGNGLNMSEWYGTSTNETWKSDKTLFQIGAAYNPLSYNTQLTNSIYIVNYAFVTNNYGEITNLAENKKEYLLDTCFTNKEPDKLTGGFVVR